MSGGSYDYLYSRSDGVLVDHYESPYWMARYIRDRIASDSESAIYTDAERGWRRLDLAEKMALLDACAELEEFGSFLRAMVVRLEERRKRMNELMHICEWVESGDWGLDAVVEWVRKDLRTEAP